MVVEQLEEKRQSGEVEPGTEPATRVSWEHLQEVRRRATPVVLYLAGPADEESAVGEAERRWPAMRRDWEAVHSGPDGLPPVFVVERGTSSMMLLALIESAVLGNPARGEEPAGFFLHPETGRAIKALLEAAPRRQTDLAEHVEMLTSFPEERLGAALELLRGVAAAPGEAMAFVRGFLSQLNAAEGE